MSYFLNTCQFLHLTQDIKKRTRKSSHYGNKSVYHKSYTLSFLLVFYKNHSKNRNKMKKFITTLFILSIGIFQSFGQAEMYNLTSQNLNKKVRKTIEHYYNYDEESGGFIKTSVNINRYNDFGNLAETYSVYDGKYGEPKPVKKLYNYNSKGQLISTTDISDEIGTYSSDLVYSYDSSGNLTKKETVYKSGGGSYSIFTFDSKGREIKEKYFDKSGKMTSENTTSYSGKNKTTVFVSYSSQDGSIIGTYTTIYENGIKTTYISKGKYSDNKATYTYDKFGNLLSSVDVGKDKTHTTTYDYFYDNKDNWVKKHYRSGKYQYFYFREIHFDDGEVSGSAEFDRQFINKFGNFPNVNVVSVVKKDLKNNTNNTNKNSGMPTISNTNWNYTYVNMKDKISDISGRVFMSISGKSRIETGAKASFTVEITGAETKILDYNVNDYYYDEASKRHFWLMKTTNNVSDGTLCIFQTPMVLREKTVKGLLMMGAEDNKITFYLL